MPLKRPAAFVLTSSNHGTMIVNRNDYNMNNGVGYGVGYQILNFSCFDPQEVSLVTTLLSLRRKCFGDGVVAVDCGANIGVHTIEWAKHMFGWGEVQSFEAQEYVYYALAGNVVINNCFNTRVHHAAVGIQNGEIKIPFANPLLPASFGSLELRKSVSNEFIGQKIDYNDSAMKTVQMRCIDSFGWPRVDLIKIDVEGMEEDVLKGAKTTIAKHKPIMLIETIKSDMNSINEFLSIHGYRSYPLGINSLNIHKSDPVTNHINLVEKPGNPPLSL